MSNIGNPVNDFWEEFNEYRMDKVPGKEYERMQMWAEDLELDTFFNLKEVTGD